MRLTPLRPSWSSVIRTGVIVCGMIFALLPSGAGAGELKPGQGPMQLKGSVSVTFDPAKVLFRPGGRTFVVVGASDPSGNTTRVAAYDIGLSSKIVEVAVPHTVDALAFSESGNWLYLVGTSNEQQYVTRLWMPDTPGKSTDTLKSTIKLARIRLGPAIAVGPDETLYLGDATSTRLTEIPRFAFDNSADNFEAKNVESEHFGWGRGIQTVAVSERLNLAFISYETLRRVSAVRLGEATRVVDTLDFSAAGANLYGGVTIPLALLVTSGVNIQTSKPTASLLLGDHPSATLTAVDYDPLFQTLNIGASGALGIRIDPKSVLQVDPITKLVRQPVLIGSDNRQQTILVGDLYSTQLVQMTRDVQGVALERVGQIELPGAPISLSVSSDGQAAVVAIANSRDLRTLEPSTQTSSASTGDPDVRQLQRELSALGLNAGGIDGVFGTGTKAAIGVFNSVTGSNVSISDVSSALQAVSTFRQKCATSGFGCLVNAPAK